MASKETAQIIDVTTGVGSSTATEAKGLTPPKPPVPCTPTGIFCIPQVTPPPLPPRPPGPPH